MEPKDRFCCMCNGFISEGILRPLTHGSRACDPCYAILEEVRVYGS